jgi:hypothetical protein
MFQVMELHVFVVFEERNLAWIINNPWWRVAGTSEAEKIEDFGS